MLREFFLSMKTREERLAWMVAIGADALQLAVTPLFAEGALSPADAVLDALVAVVLVRLLGWHWAFLPTLMVEALPGADLFPTWTAAVFFVTRQMHSSGEPIILPPEHSNHTRA
ncbi:MAG TPA: hypothetical protein VKF84_13635 [Candidatus Sulfotelmatobacter sp.]|nr:hypothetical protein [Candidatus Sulfotelmatobacter sp.]